MKYTLHLYNPSINLDVDYYKFSSNLPVDEVVCTINDLIEKATDGFVKDDEEHQGGVRGSKLEYSLTGDLISNGDKQSKEHSFSGYTIKIIPYTNKIENIMQDKDGYKLF